MPRDFLARLVLINKQAVWGDLTELCVRLYNVDKKADIFQHIPLLPSRLMAGPRTLDPLVKVRILGGQCGYV